MKYLPGVLVLCLVLLMPVSVSAELLPYVKLPDEFYRCEKDDDCAVAGDACRSCGQLIIINKEFLTRFDEMDQALRKKSGIIPVCEACSTADIKLVCDNGRCSKALKKPGRSAPN